MESSRAWSRANDTITILSGICGSEGLLDDCGVRVRFGNSDSPNDWKGNIKELLEHMSGFQEAGDKRPAGDAFAAGTYEAVFKMAGEGKTTLNPVVLAHAPTGTTTCPVGKISGSVSFDTESWDLRPAPDIIDISANATLESAVWSTPKTEISFVIADVDPGETITITVDHDDLLSFANTANLDGNQDPRGTDGTRPSDDDFVWTVMCASPPSDVPGLSRGDSRGELGTVNAQGRSRLSTSSPS